MMSKFSTYEQQHRIGLQYYGPTGDVWKYIKVIFGEYPEGEACSHQWVPWNGTAQAMDFTDQRPEYAMPIQRMTLVIQGL